MRLFETSCAGTLEYETLKREAYARRPVDIAAYNASKMPGSIGSSLRQLRGIVSIETNELETFQEVLLAKNYKHAKPRIEETPWGSRDMSVTDPFGNRLTFTNAVNT